jgi:cytochrome aa3-600 menaquinol oxidase subunit 2
MFKPSLRRSMKGLGAAVMMSLLLSGCQGSMIVLDPKGPVGQTELKLITISAILCAVVVIPVLGLLVYIVYRYRDKPGNKAPYTPEWSDSKTLEIIWWGIPIVIIGILGVFTFKGIHSLTKPPVQNATPLTIQVTSLDWKWLFQYPDQNIATVNYCEIPAGVPIQFVLTSDAPMNSFWVPQLGGQEYTMPGMAMRLWLQADKAGEYFGSGANFSGEGFAHMQFKVVAKPQSDFNSWVQQVKQGSQSLTKAGYDRLAKPGLSDERSFASYPPGLFDDTVNKNGGMYYMHGMQAEAGSSDMHMNMNMNMDMGK